MSESKNLRPTAIANTLLLGCGIVCSLVWVDLAYHYGWVKDRHLTNSLGIIWYFSCPAVLAGCCFWALRWPLAYRINFGLTLFSLAFTIYAAETAMTVMALWSSLPSYYVAKDLSARLKAAKEMGIAFDARSKLEFVVDLRNRGIDAYPTISPLEDLLETHPDKTLRSKISIGGVEFLPFGGISNKVSVLDNESGAYITYVSDEHGFHNPPGLWNTGRVGIAAVGDSFVHGYSVPSDKNFVSLIRDHYPSTLNLGIFGIGPLEELAILTEYARHVKPKLLLWFYFEGNDLRDLNIEKNSPWLMRYLTENFDQHLIDRQAEIDRALAAYAGAQVKNPQNKSRRWIRELREAIGGPRIIEDIFKLTTLRKKVKLVYGETSATFKYQDVLPLFSRVLLKASERVKSWGGMLEFVYLPSWETFGDPSSLDNREELVLAIVKSLGIPIINLHQAFAAQSDPLDLFPFRLNGHYNEKGNRLVAQEVRRSISSAR